jgi:hypothetical protein
MIHDARAAALGCAEGRRTSPVIETAAIKVADACDDACGQSPQQCGSTSDTARPRRDDANRTSLSHVLFFCRLNYDTGELPNR